MSAEKFTKGPWRVANGVNVLAGVSRYVAVTSGLENRSAGVFKKTAAEIDALNDEDAANARLIAAAPQMFEALKYLVAHCKGMDRFADNPINQALADARSALAAATGGA